jgi:hypothetical protein
VRLTAFRVLCEFAVGVCGLELFTVALCRVSQRFSDVIMFDKGNGKLR